MVATHPTVDLIMVVVVSFCFLLTAGSGIICSFKKLPIITSIYIISYGKNVPLARIATDNKPLYTMHM